MLWQGQFVHLFLQVESNGYRLLFTLYGLSNDRGLLAVLLLCLLLALSNTVSLRWLKGKRCKRLQRLTYVLAPLAVVHTFGFQYLNLRGSLFFASVSGLVGLTVLGQAGGCSGDARFSAPSRLMHF